MGLFGHKENKCSLRNYQVCVSPGLYHTTYKAYHGFVSLSNLVRYGKLDINFGFENVHASCLSCSASFLCAALMSPKTDETMLSAVRISIEL